MGIQSSKSSAKAGERPGGGTEGLGGQEGKQGQGCSTGTEGTGEARAAAGAAGWKAGCEIGQSQGKHRKLISTQGIPEEKVTARDKGSWSWRSWGELSVLGHSKMNVQN